jgi:uncharacterized membrane protein YsdA (DUF1294 family)
MKAHPYRVWGFVAALLAAVIGFLLYRYLDIGLLGVYLCAINLATFVLFWYDKTASRKEGAGRVPNQILFGLSAVGGALGALAGMRVFHHKTGLRYRWWRLVVWVSLLIYIALFLRWLL